MLCSPHLDNAIVADPNYSPALPLANSLSILKAVSVVQGDFPLPQQVRPVLLQERPRTIVFDDPELIAPLVGAIAVEYIHLF